MPLVAAALVLQPAHAFAQDATDAAGPAAGGRRPSGSELGDARPFWGKTVRRVTFDPPSVGSSLRTSPERASGIAVGSTLGAAAVRAAVGRLYATRRFRDVRVLAEAVSGGVGVVLDVDPRVRLARVVIEGNRAFDLDDLRRAIGFVPERDVTPEAAAEFAETIRRFYGERGFADMEVAAELNPTEEVDRVTLSVRIREGQPQRIRGVRWRGHTALPLGDLDAALDVGSGTIADQRALREGVRRVRELYREHRYYNAQIGEPVLEPAAGAAAGTRWLHLTLVVDAGDRFTIEFRGARAVPRDDLLASLQLDQERDLSAGVLRTLTDRIKEVLVRKGFYHAEVRAEVSRSVARREQTIRFVIDPGPVARVTRLGFEGMRHFDARFLREQIDSFLEEAITAPAVFQPVHSGTLDALGVSGRPGVDQPPYLRDAPLRVEPREVYAPAVYQQALDHIVGLYKTAGYLEARFDPPEVTELDGGMTLHVRIRVHEGPQTRIDEVVFNGNSALASGVLGHAIDLRRGEPLGYLAVEQTRATIERLYASRGFFFARVTAGVDLSEDRRHARVRFSIVEHVAVRVARVLVRGNDHTAEVVVRARLAFGPGSLFTPEAIRATEQRLGELGIFRTVAIDLLDPDVIEANKTVVIRVRERLPQYLDVRAGFTTGQGARGAIEYGYRNLFGYGVRFSGRIQLGYRVFFTDRAFEQSYQRLALIDQIERRIVVGVAVPQLPGLGSTLTPNLDFVHLRENHRAFGLDQNALVLSLVAGLRKPVAAQVQFSLENNDLNLLETLCQPDQRLRQLLRVPEGISTIGAVRPTLSLDYRDNPFVPTRGAFFSLSSELLRSFLVEGVDTPSFFVRVAATASGYVPVASGWVLALTARWGRIVHLEPQEQRPGTFPNRRFFLGGVNSLRGFNEESLIAQDVADAFPQQQQAAGLPTRTPWCDLTPEAARIGGDEFINVRSELRFPLVFGFEGGVFLDAGNVWSDPDAPSVNRTVLRYTAGFGIRYSTPVGPLAFDYGIKLNPRAYLNEGFGQFHFSIGVF